MSSAIPLARRLAAALEPIAGQAQFSPECHANYAALGFPPSPGLRGRTSLPEFTSFWTSRTASMGDTSPEVVASALAVFNPAVVLPAVRRGRELCDAATIWAARVDGAAAQLRRILGPNLPDIERVTDALLAASNDLPLAGRPLFAGGRAVEVPDEPFARLWRAADRLREYRGDSHVQVWGAAGFDPVEIGLLSDLYWGLAPRAHTGGRGWTDDQLAAGEDRLRIWGLLSGRSLTDQGRAVRESIETQTDAAMQRALAVLGDTTEQLITLIEPWGAAILDAGGYLTPLVRFTFNERAPQ
jgi:hypothetical protein